MISQLLEALEHHKKQFGTTSITNDDLILILGYYQEIVEDNESIMKASLDAVINETGPV